MASYVEIIRLFLSSQTLDFRKNTPAYAGNTSDPSSTIPVFRDRPRLRGEYGRLPVPLIVPVGSPPLARGIPPIDPHRTKDGRITPACAGNTVFFFISAIGEEDHPRLRGEYSRKCPTNHILRGSPPLARGIHLDFLDFVRAVRITPACAGNTLSPKNKGRQTEDHPRLRGEYKERAKKSRPSWGSPPLARGILEVLEIPPRLEGITPACAGNTARSHQPLQAYKDHPRLRGEYEKDVAKKQTNKGSPPLARGIQAARYKITDGHGITPACAGNTFNFLILCRKAQDHPRLRGEYRSDSQVI